MRRATITLAATLLLAASASAGHLTSIDGERAVVYGGRTWTWEQIQARRATDPARFDANHPTLGLALRDTDAMLARRDLDPARFDRFHPYLGWLLGGLGKPDPVIPCVPPPACPNPPIHAVPEPSSLVLAAVGLGLAIIRAAKSMLV